MMPSELLPPVYSIENIRAENKGSSDFDIFPFGYFTKDIERLKKSHRHEFYTLIVITGGSGSHIIDFEEYPIKPGRIFLIDYGQVHSWVSVKNVKGFVVFFTEDFYNLIFTGNEKIKSDSVLLHSSPFIDAGPKERPVWVNSLNIIISEFRLAETGYREIICLLLKTLIVRFTRHTSTVNIKEGKAGRKSVLLLNYKKLINLHYTKWKLPKQYTGLLYVTPNYLNAVCNEIAAASATRLIRDRVILEAKRMLTHTPMTVTEVANFLGFEDNSHFGKYFKAETGNTPDGFRKSFLRV